jgi:hypothetical protein
MTYEQAAIERRTFQSDTQIRMLQIHQSLADLASRIYSPVRKVLESFTDTEVFVQRGAKLRVIK